MSRLTIIKIYKLNFLKIDNDKLKILSKIFYNLKNNNRNGKWMINQ